MLILEPLIDFILLLGCSFGGVYAKNHPDRLARYCFLGREPSAAAVRYFRTAGIVFLALSILGTIVMVAFFGWSIYMAFHL